MTRDELSTIDEIADYLFFRLRSIPHFLRLEIKIQLLDFDLLSSFEGHLLPFSYINLTDFDLSKHTTFEWANIIADYMIAREWNWDAMLRVNTNA